MNVGKYLEPASNGNGNYSVTNPTARLTTTVWRPGVDRRQQQLQAGLRSVEHGPAGHPRQRAATSAARATTNFGKQVFATTYDPAILGAGASVRRTGASGVSIQQEILPRVSIEVGYNRRWLNGFSVTDNLLVSAGGLRTVQRHGAGRPAAAGWRRVHGLRAVQRQPRQVRADRTIS